MGATLGMNLVAEADSVPDKVHMIGCIYTEEALGEPDLCQQLPCRDGI